jgi:UDP-glucose 4-epimerase
MKATDYYKGKTVLVTGASGFIGSSLIKALQQVDCALMCCSRNAQNPETGHSAKAKIVNLQMDIRNPSIWDDILQGVDVVFHFAAQTSAGFANQHPEADLDVNVVPIARFLETCQRKGIRPDMVFPGTVTQAGLTRVFPVNESTRDNPVTIYDINKLTSENYLSYYAGQLGGRAVTLRLANIYGPGPKSGRPDRGILNMMVMRAIEGKPLTVYGDGNYVRDYLFIDDTIDAFLLAGSNLDKTNGRHYVTGSGVGHTISEMAQAVRDMATEITGKKAAIEHVDPPADLSPIEFRHFVADTARFKADSGWIPRVSFEKGIKRTMTFFLGRQKNQ